MKITREDLFKIMDMSKDKKILQVNRLYFDTPLGEKEASHEEMNAIAFIEAITTVLELDDKLDVDYHVIKKEF